MAACIHKRQGRADGSHNHIFLKISSHPSQFKLDFGSISTFVPFESGDHFFLENSFMHISNSNTQSNILRQTFILKPTCVLGLTSQMNVKSSTWGFLLQLLLKVVVLSTFFWFFFFHSPFSCQNLFGREVANKTECAANWNLARQLTHLHSARTSSVLINIHLSKLITLILKND